MVRLSGPGLRTVSRDLTRGFAGCAGVAQLVEQRFCKPSVAGSSPIASTIRSLTFLAEPAARRWASGSTDCLGVCPSGQRERAVNPSALAYGGSNPPAPTIQSVFFRGNSSVGRASAFQAEGRGFESRFPLHSFSVNSHQNTRPCSSAVEHLLGKEEVTSSSLVMGSISNQIQRGMTAEADRYGQRKV